MAEPTRAQKGDWVEIERIILDPSQRSKNLPPETAETPLRMWVKGFAQADGNVGEELTVETTTGRQVTGRLVVINPGYFHTFGRPIAELQRIGIELRRRLAQFRGTKAGV
jgi:hypothetical protein